MELKIVDALSIEVSPEILKRLSDLGFNFPSHVKDHHLIYSKKKEQVYLANITNLRTHSSLKREFPQDISKLLPSAGYSPASTGLFLEIVSFFCSGDREKVPRKFFCLPPVYNLKGGSLAYETCPNKSFIVWKNRLPYWQWIIPLVKITNENS